MKPALPSATAGRATVPLTPLPVNASKSLALPSASPRFGRGRDDRARRADARSPARGSPRAAASSSSSSPRAGRRPSPAGLPSVSVPVLSTTSVSTFSQPLQRLGIPDQHARLGAAPDADHDRHRRREAERARAGDDQHRDRGDQRVGEARLRPEQRPGGKGDQRRRRSPPARTSRRPGRPAAGSARGCAAPARPSARSAPAACRAPTFSARMTKLPVPLSVPPITLAPGSFSTGIDSPVTIDSSTATAPSDRPRRRPGPSRRAAPAAGRRPRRRRAATSSSLPSPATRRAVLRREIEQGADRAGRSRSRARSSSTWPSRTSTVITAAASK